MQKIFEEYGGVIHIVAAIIALVTICGVIFAGGNGGVLRDSLDGFVKQLSSEDVVTKYSEEQIAADDTLYGIGLTQPDYVVAKFNEDYTSVTITKNGEDSDGKMMNWISPEDATSESDFSPMTSQITKDILITTINVEPGITSIGDYAFSYCMGVKEINIPETVTEIGDYVFFCCDSLEVVNIPKGSMEIGSFLFIECNNIREVDLRGVSKVGMGALASSGVKKIEVSEALKVMEDYCFDGCAIESFVIPSSVESIGVGVFAGCGRLVDITFENTMEEIPDEMFRSTGFQNFNVPETVTSIGKKAFDGCSNLEAISFPEGVRVIGEQAFANCTGLKNVDFPSSLEDIEVKAFYKCKALETLEIPTTITEIKDSVFEGARFVELRIPSNIEHIGANAFKNAVDLKNVYLPKTVKSIGNEAFHKGNGWTTIYCETEDVYQMAFYSGFYQGSTTVKLDASKFT